MPLLSPGAVSPLLLGHCRGAKSWKRNLFKVFRTHVNGQNLLTAELKYLFLLRNKALLLDLSATGFVPQAGEKSLQGGRNRHTGRMPWVCVVCLHSHRFVWGQRGSTSPHGRCRVAHKTWHILDIRRHCLLPWSFERLQVAVCPPLTVGNDSP